MPGKIAIVYSSTWGHVRTLAVAMAEAARATGAQVDIYRFPELLSDEVRTKMYAVPHDEAHKEITPEVFATYDGFLLGSSTRYGRVSASASAFFDSTGGLWQSGALYGKFAGIFTTGAAQHGGQETTALTTIPFLAHHGICFVPIGFAAPQLTDNSEIVGGSAYGAASIANNDGSRQVSTKELEVAAFQGKTFATLVNTFVAGKESLSINGSNVTQAQAYKTQTEDREASTSTVTRKVSTPSARKTRTHDAHGKGCCTIA